MRAAEMVRWQNAKDDSATGPAIYSILHPAEIHSGWRTNGRSFPPAHPGRAKTRPFPHGGAQRDLLASERSASTVRAARRQVPHRESEPSLTALETGG